MTAVDVRAVRFPRPASGTKGYDEHAVDEFMERIAEALAGRSALAPEEVHGVAFPSAQSGRHGYDAHQVDEFLEQVEWQLRLGRVAPTKLHTSADLRAMRLPKVTHGYDVREVDLFLNRAAAALDGRGPMSAREVRQTRFSTSSGLHRGYRIAMVDALLEILEQELRSRGR